LWDGGCVIARLFSDVRRKQRAEIPQYCVMSNTRRARIEALLADDPTDQFLRYSLAMELEKEGDNDQSLARLSQLQSDATAYVPAFFMAAQQLVKLSRISEAQDALRRGIEEARQQGNAHAAGEMSELLASLGREGE